MGMKTIQIDGSRLKRELKKQKLAMSRISKDMGLSANYLSNCCHNEQIAALPLDYLTRNYGIEYADIKPQTETPAAETKNEQETRDIMTAVEYGVTEALEYVIEKYGVNVITKALEVFASEYALYKVGGVFTFRKREDMRNED